MSNLDLDCGVCLVVYLLHVGNDLIALLVARPRRHNTLREQRAREQRPAPQAPPPPRALRRRGPTLAAVQSQDTDKEPLQRDEHAGRRGRGEPDKQSVDLRDGTARRTSALLYALGGAAGKTCARTSGVRTRPLD